MRLRNALQRRKLWLMMVGAGATITVLTGCGGSGINTNPNSTGLASGSSSRSSDAATDKSVKGEAERGRLGIFITVAGAVAGYDRFWVDIRKIELLDADETGAIVFDGATDNFVTDLTQLVNEKAPRFALVGVGAVPTGKSYTRARITFGKGFSLLPTGAAAALSLPIADSVGRDASDNPQITVSLEKPRDFGNGKQNLALAFDLAKTLIRDGRVTPSIKEAKWEGLAQTERQIPATFTGAVSDLHFGEKETTFSLGIAPNRSVTVSASDAVRYFNSTATPNPILKEGYKVAVRGVLSPDTKRVNAYTVAIYGENAPGMEIAGFEGALESADAPTLSVSLSPVQAQGMMPTARAITAQLTADAVLRGPGGLLLTSEQFFDALKRKNARLAVEGSYEPVTATFRAVRASIAEPDNLPAFAASAEGTPKSINATEGKFTVSDLTNWQGILGKSEGKGISAVTSPATLYFDGKGDPLTAAHFYAALQESDHAVRIIGLYAKGALGVTRVTLLPPAPKSEATVFASKGGGAKSKSEGDAATSSRKAESSGSGADTSKEETISVPEVIKSEPKTVKP